jgi:signal transduction histidine kinase
VPGGLRAQLALAIALVTLLGVGASFLALYSGTSARLRGQIDAQLRTQAAEWRQFAAGADLSTPDRLRATAARFIASQRYHAESLIIAIQTNTGALVDNNPDLLAREEGREQRSPDSIGLLNAPTGLSTASVAEAGSMRVLTQPIRSRSRVVGMLRVADPLTSVARAQASMQHTFLFVGLIALVLAVAVGLALASLIAAPLRRVTGVAKAVNAGDLSVRAGPVNAAGELRLLADSFDRMLDRLERTISRQRDFVSDASHELRTPLAVLRAQVELLDREIDEQRRHDATSMLLRRLDQLDRLVSDLLTLASADTGHLVQPRTIDLGEFFEDVRRDLPLFGQRNFRLESVDGTLSADPDRLTQVLRNLVRNAVTSTQPGGHVTITARACDGRLEIAVTDDGPGIPAGELDHIFERFHRLDPSRSRDSGGSGLGLAIARAIIDAHGGTIHAESTEGHGATFRIELPDYQPPRDCRQQPAAALRPHGVEG